MAHAFVAMGSNLGKRQAALRAALRLLGELQGTRVDAVAIFRETEPVDAPAGSGNFMNSAVRLETGLGPQKLLAALLEIERSLGRDRIAANTHHGPRTIDLDLLLYDDQVIDTPELQLPHPRMHVRAFVLEPLNEIAAEVRHPVLGRTIGLLWAELQKGEEQR